MNRGDLCLVSLLGILITQTIRLEALQCFECANLKGRRDTCNDQERKVINSTSEVGVQCRVFTFGGVVVGQGMVSDVLCSDEALVRSNLAIGQVFSGSGKTQAQCCGTSLCNGDPSEVAGQGVSSSTIPPTTLSTSPTTASLSTRNTNDTATPRDDDANGTTLAATSNSNWRQASKAEEDEIEEEEELDIAARLSKNGDETQMASMQAGMESLGSKLCLGWTPLAFIATWVLGMALNLGL